MLIFIYSQCQPTEPSMTFNNHKKMSKW